MANPATLLLTRPRAASERFAMQLHAKLGAMPIMISPLLEIAFHDFDPPRADHLLFTSRNGVEAWQRARGMAFPCFCVGDSTAQAARAAGHKALACGGTVSQMLEDIQLVQPKGALLHVRGEHTRGALAENLRRRGFDAEEVTAYAQHPKDLCDEARALLEGGEPVILPLFSPRSAAQFEAQRVRLRNVDIIAISNTAAAECPAARVATFPNAEGMIDAIASSPLHQG